MAAAPLTRRTRPWSTTCRRVFEYGHSGGG